MDGMGGMFTCVFSEGVGGVRGMKFQSSVYPLL